MGILDDAIREHLELKRQHGAESDDLERLENEAFGPATRPGDPEFATGEEPAAPAAEEEASPDESPFGAAPEAPAEEAPAGGSTPDWPAVEKDATTVAPEASDAPSTEAGRAEYPGLGDTADHPAPDSPSEEAPPVAEEPAPATFQEPEAPALEEPLPPEGGATPAEPPEAPESSIFDGGDLDFGDLDLDEEDDGTVARQAGTEDANPFITDEEDLSLAFEEEVPPTGESAIPPRNDALLDGAVEEDTGNPPLPVPPREEPAGQLEEPLPPRAADEEDEGEDVLEETPDFLRDTPEGDRAWFEQDPPKDFDFDD